MMGQNLSTAGVTRSVLQQGQGLTVSQYTQVSFGARPKVRALTVFSQNGSTLTTEQISDPRHDLVRYRQVKLAGRAAVPDLHTVIGKWAQLPAGQSMTGQLNSGLFNQSVLDVLPMADLAAKQRHALIGTMRAQHIFSYDKRQVSATIVHGRPVYLYAVSIQTPAYVRLMQQFETMMGGTAYASLQPSSYQHAPAMSVVLSVDRRTHQLTQLYEPQLARTQTYQGYGIADTAPLPRATITTTELTRRLASLQR